VNEHADSTLALPAPAPGQLVGSGSGVGVKRGSMGAPDGEGQYGSDSGGGEGCPNNILCDMGPHLYREEGAVYDPG
jgi:hypothetical protein